MTSLQLLCNIDITLGKYSSRWYLALACSHCAQKLEPVSLNPRNLGLDRDQGLAEQWSRPTTLKDVS